MTQWHTKGFYQISFPLFQTLYQRELKRVHYQNPNYPTSSNSNIPLEKWKYDHLKNLYRPNNQLMVALSSGQKIPSPTGKEKSKTHNDKAKNYGWEKTTKRHSLRNDWYIQLTYWVIKDITINRIKKLSTLHVSTFRESSTLHVAPF